MEKKLEVKDLRISFRTDAGKVQAVRGISFDLYKGETLAIVGESGSGKSVTNKAIIGISAVNAIVESGEILYDGQDLLRISEEDFHKLRGDKIAMIFQDPLSALDPICRIGKQMTEAMILKNRANRRNSRKDFNGTIKRLLHAMNRAMDAEEKSEQALKNEANIAFFDKFETHHLKLQIAYNKAYEGATLGAELIDELVFRIEKHAVNDFRRVIAKVFAYAKDAIHPYVAPEAETNQRLASLKASVKQALKAKDYSICVEDLQALSALLKASAPSCEEDKPNYFAIGYYETKHEGEPLPYHTDIRDLNAKLHKILDDEFMLSFIEDEKKGLNYSLAKSVEHKKEAIALLTAKRAVYEGTPDKKLYKETAKELIAAVEKGIDRLALVKDSTAYTFKSSIVKAIDDYFDAIPNNAKEQKRYDRDMAKYNKLIARGKTPDYKVVPAKIVDLDLAKETILMLIDRVVDDYEKAIATADSYDADAGAVALIDYLKAKAEALAYRVTHAIAKSRALKLMEEVGIPEPEKRYRQYPFQFSGGMRQRIVIAIALAANPDILICDEPTTALDVTIQAQILELINKIKKERNLSIIFITHDLGVVANMADRIAVMYAGKIVETGTAEDVFYSPAHPYTWALLSSMPDLDTNEKLEAIPGTPPNMIYPPKGDAFAARNKYAMKIDFELEPPMFDITETHKAATWLLHPDAPKIEMPKTVSDRIARMKKLAADSAANNAAEQESNVGGSQND